MPRLRGEDSEYRDEVRQPLYDSIYIAAGETPIKNRSFFSDIQGKAKYLTNLRQPNILEGKVSYLVQGLVLDAQNWYEANRQVLPLLMERSYVKLRIGEKDYWEGNALFAAGRLDVNQAVTRSSGTGEAAGTVVERQYQRYGDSVTQSVQFKGKHCIPIPPLQSFRVDMETASSALLTAAPDEVTAATPAANTRLLLIMSLKGLLRRPVQ